MKPPHRLKIQTKFMRQNLTMILVLQRKAGEISETLKKIEVNISLITPEDQRSLEYEMNKKRAT